MKIINTFCMCSFTNTQIETAADDIDVSSARSIDKICTLQLIDKSFLDIFSYICVAYKYDKWWAKSVEYGYGEHSCVCVSTFMLKV